MSLCAPQTWLDMGSPAGDFQFLIWRFCIPDLPLLGAILADQQAGA
jgi:hypothetical protein